MKYLVDMPAILLVIWRCSKGAILETQDEGTI